MVKKLFKHEMLYYIRSLLPVYAALLGVAVIGRVIALFETDSDGYYILRGSSIGALVITAVVALVLSVIFCILRFYKNMFSGEGYLTLTLPVTAPQHLWVKWLSGALSIVATLAAVVLSVCVFTLGGWLVELWKVFAYIYTFFVKHCGIGHIAGYTVEGIVLVLVYILSVMMLFYMCICVGQTFRKNRVLAAVGVYFVLYLITQALGTAVTMIGTIFYEQLQLEALARLINLHTEEFLHVFFCGAIVVSTVMSTVYFLICRYVLTKKLDLE